MLIYDALRKDHEKLKSLLSQLVNLSENNKEERHNLIEMIRNELVPHARAEESVFYNSLRSIDSAKDLIMHIYHEHMEAEAVLRALQVMDKIDMNWKKSARNLQKAIEHHIQEEEGKIFPAAQKLFTEEEARMMGEAFERLKPEVKTEGFMKTTIDMVTHLMPPRFAASLRTRNLNSILERPEPH